MRNSILNLSLVDFLNMRYWDLSLLHHYFLCPYLAKYVVFRNYWKMSTWCLFYKLLHNFSHEYVLYANYNPVGISIVSAMASQITGFSIFTPQPSGLEGYCRHGPGGRAGGCQTCGTHISVTAWWIFSVRSSMELSRPVVVHCYAHLPICPIWACPWAKNLSNLPQIGSRLCGSHISETAGWIYPI